MVDEWTAADISLYTLFVDVENEPLILVDRNAQFVFLAGLIFGQPGGSDCLEIGRVSQRNPPQVNSLVRAAGVGTLHQEPFL